MQSNPIPPPSSGNQGSSSSGQQYPPGHQPSSSSSSSGQQQHSSGGQFSSGQHQGLTSVNNYWNLIRINRVDNVEVVNHEIYRGPTTQQLKPGHLGKADIRLTLSAAYNVRSESIAVRYRTRKFPLSKEIRLELGTVSQSNEPPVPVSLGQSVKFEVTIPLVRDEASSIADKINLKKGGSTTTSEEETNNTSKIVHYTIVIPGESFTGTLTPSSFYIRLNVDLQNNQVDLKSINQSFMDYSRAQTTANNLLGWLKGMAIKLKGKALNSKNQSTIKSSGNQGGIQPGTLPSHQTSTSYPSQPAYTTH